jgi:hypothetical protein
VQSHLTQTSNNKPQPITNNQQPTTNNQQPTTNNQQPTTNNQQRTTSTQQQARTYPTVISNFGQGESCRSVDEDTGQQVAKFSGNRVQIRSHRNNAAI